MVTLSSFSQNMWAISYGDNYSFGIEMNTINSNIDFYKENSTSVDSSFKFNYLNIIPKVQFHYLAFELENKDLIYLDGEIGILFNLGVNVNGERAIPIKGLKSHIQLGFSYFKGEEFGFGYYGSLGLMYQSLSSFSFPPAMLSPYLSVGYQFELNEQLFRVYAKAAVNVFTKKKNTDYFSGFNDFESYVNRDISFGIGITYRGLN